MDRGDVVPPDMTVALFPSESIVFAAAKIDSVSQSRTSTPL